MRKKFLVFSKPEITQDDIILASKVLKSGWVGTGPLVKEFEKKFANFKNISESNVIALNSCTSALSLALKALNFEPESEIITTPMTFCSTINSIVNAKLKPVFVDIDIDTRNINAEKIEEKITKKTRALLVVHFAGLPCNMDKIMAIVKKYNLKLIEDCAHAIESEFKGKKTGTFGDFSCFSFYATKNLTTGGEGGILISKNKKNASYCRNLSLHGMSKDAWNRFNKKGFFHYDVIESGYKYNLTDLSASIGLGGLNRIKKNLSKRKLICQFYSENLKKLPLRLPNFFYENNIKHAHHLYNILITKKSNITRDQLAVKLNKLNIGIGIHYRSIGDFTYYKNKFNLKKNNFPFSELVGNTNLSLPLSASMTQYDMISVIKALKKIFND